MKRVKTFLSSDTDQDIRAKKSQKIERRVKKPFLLLFSFSFSRHAI